MEALFENSYVRNKELAKEIYRYFYFRRKLVIVCYVLLALSFLLNVLSAILGGNYSLAVFIFVPLLILFRIYRYFSQVKTVVKQDQEVHGKEIAETIVTNEYIQNTASTGAVNKLEYGKIRSAVQTKNLILLRTKANLIYIFRKDTFTLGTKDEFMAFLKEKGIKVS